MQRTSIEVNVYMQRHQTHYVGNVNYHKFSHNGVSYRFSGVNVHVRIHLKSFGKTFNPEFMKIPFLQTVKITKVILSRPYNGR